MRHPTATVAPANDNRDLFETPEGAYFQLLRARRRHLALDTAAMTSERLGEWRRLLADLDEAGRALRPHLWAGASAPPPVRAPARPRGGRLRALAGLFLVALPPLAGRRRG
jgi:hypothetical protein